MEQTHLQLINNAKCTILKTDKLGFVNHMNPFAEQFFGCSSQEMFGKNVMGTIFQESSLSTENINKTHTDLATCFYVNQILEAKLQNGNSAWLGWITLPILNDSGELVEHLCLANDLSGRLQTAKVLNASEGKYRDINKRFFEMIDFLADGMIIIDREHRVIAWNPAMEELTGIPKEVVLGKGNYEHGMAILGKRCPMLIDLVLDSKSESDAIYSSLKKCGEAILIEKYAKGIQGGRGGHVQCKVRLLHDHKENVIGAVESIREISQQKKMESMLQKQERELKEISLKNQEINTALKVLLRNNQDNEKQFGENVFSNIHQAVLPIILQLENSGLSEMQRAQLALLKTQIENISSPFLSKLYRKVNGLSSAELQVATLIKQGKRNKEMAQILGVSINTVLSHRHHLRKKLGLTNRATNLTAYLKNVDQSLDWPLTADCVSFEFPTMT